MPFGEDDNHDQDPTQDPAPATPEVPAEILKKIENQDQFIETLKAEAKERDEQMIKILEKQAGAESAAASKDDIKSLIETLKSNKPDTSGQESSPGTEISIDEIVGAVGDKFKQEALESKRASNLLDAMDAAKEAYGEDEFDKKVISIAKSKQMSVEAVNDMARNTPQVFKELFLPTANPKSDIDPTSSNNSSAGLDPTKPVEKRSITSMSAKERSAYVQSMMKKAMDAQQ